jgi:hypothetical protein
MNWLDRILGKKSPKQSPDQGAPSNRSDPVPTDSAQKDEVPDSQPDPEMQRQLEQGCDARAAVLSRLGALDTDVLAPLMNPTFMGGPKWPSLRQSWRVVRRPASTILVSDGLSDPFEDEGIPLGFRVEVCAEAPELFETPHHSWLFDMVFQISQLIANHGKVDELLQKYKTLSTVVSVGSVPAHFQNEKGQVGVIIGFPTDALPAGFDLEHGRVRLLVIKLLLPSELAYIESADDLEAGRNSLVAMLQGSPDAHLSSVTRAAVI